MLTIEIGRKDYYYENKMKQTNIMVTKYNTGIYHILLISLWIIQLYMLTRVFSTKVVSLHRASNTEPKKHQNLLGKPLLKKLDDETQKKVKVQT